MRLRASNLLPLLLVFFLAALTLWLRYAVEGPSSDGSASKRHDPDAVVDNFTVTRLDESGKPRYLISARRMIHNSGDDSAELESPRFLRTSSGSEMTVTADRGRITHDQREAIFSGNVQLVRSATGEKQELRARTEYLHIFAEQDKVRTDRRVTITEGKSTLSGVGMEADKQAGRFTLYSQVRGIYDVPKTR